MSSPLSISAAAGLNASPVRTEIPVFRPAAVSSAPVTSELPPAQAVEATGDTQSAHTQGQRRPPLAPSQEGSDSTLLVQKLSFDEATHLIVYSTVDDATGYVVNQFPDKVVLRQKAYFRQQLDQAAVAGREGKLA